MKVYNIEMFWMVDELTTDSSILITLDQMPNIHNKERILEIIGSKCELHDYQLLIKEIDELLEYGSSPSFTINPREVHNVYVL